MHSVTFNLKLVVYCKAEFTIDYFAKQNSYYIFHESLMVKKFTNTNALDEKLITTCFGKRRIYMYVSNIHLRLLFLWSLFKFIIFLVSKCNDLIDVHVHLTFFFLGGKCILIYDAGKKKCKIITQAVFIKQTQVHIKTGNIIETPR